MDPAARDAAARRPSASDGTGMATVDLERRVGETARTHACVNTCLNSAPNATDENGEGVTDGVMRTGADTARLAGSY